MENWETEYYKIKFRATFRTKTQALSRAYDIWINPEYGEKNFQLGIKCVDICRFRRIMRLFDLSYFCHFPIDNA